MRAFAAALALCLLAGGADAQFNNVPTAPPSGLASGDLTGSYPSPRAVGMQRVLGSLRSANMNTTADQAITIVSTVTKYLVTAVLATNCSATPTLAVGAVYTAASKGGAPLFSAAQVFSSLNATTVLLNVPSTITTAVVTAPQLFLTLTTAAGGASLCDIYVVGVDLT